MFANELLIDIIKRQFTQPSDRILHALQHPDASNVFHTLFSLMYNGLPREHVNEFYCEYIAGDVKLSRVGINNSFDKKSVGFYPDFNTGRFNYRSAADSDIIYHLYTPFYCPEYDDGGVPQCFATAVPSLLVEPFAPPLNQISEGGEIVLHHSFRNYYPLSDSRYDDIPEYNVRNGDVTDINRNFVTIRVTGSAGQSVDISVTYSNCLGSVRKNLTYVILEEEPNRLYQGVFNACGDDPGRHVNHVLATGVPFDSNKEYEYRYFLRKCEGPFEEFFPEAGIIPPIFKDFQVLENPLEYTFVTDIYDYIRCDELNRYTIRAQRYDADDVYSVDTEFDSIGGLPFFYFLPDNGNYITRKSFFDEASLTDENAYLFTREYFPQLLDRDGMKTHSDLYKVYIKNTPGISNPHAMYYSWSPTVDACDTQTNELVEASIYSAGDAMPDYKYFMADANVSVSKLPGLSYDQNNMFSDEGIPIIPNEPYTFMVDLPTSTAQPIYYRVKVQLNCAVRYSLIKLMLYPKREISVRRTLAQGNLRSYDISVFEDQIDVTDQYQFQVISDLDGDISPDGFSTPFAPFSLNTVGSHQLTFVGQSLHPEDTLTFVAPDLVTAPSFTICTPDVTGNLISQFRDEYMNAPCKSVGDGYSVAAGKSPLVWSDHLAYAALMHARYLNFYGKDHPSGAHYEVDTQPNYFGVDIGTRVRNSNYGYISCGEGISNESSYCDHFRLFEGEYTDNMDPNNAGHFGPWVKPPPTDPKYANVYVKEIGYARVGQWSVTVYGDPKSLTGPVPELPSDLATVSNETSLYRVDTLYYQTCLFDPLSETTSNPVVSWFSDIQGSLGDSPFIDGSSKLIPGTHELTAVYIKDGVQYRDSVIVEIAPKCEIQPPVSNASISPLTFEQCSRTFNDYRLANNVTPALSPNDYLMWECLRHAYYLHKNGIDALDPNLDSGVYAGDEDLTLPYSGVAVDARSRIKASGYKFFSCHFSCMNATNPCDAWYKIENDLTNGRPPAHHFLSTLYEHYGVASYGNWTCIAMASLNSEWKPLVMYDIPAQANVAGTSTYAYSVADPDTGLPIELLWDSSLDGPLGSFTELNSGNSSLSPGTHTLTATGNAACGPVSTSFDVLIVPSFNVDVVLNGYDYTVTVVDSTFPSGQVFTFSSDVAGVFGTGQTVDKTTSTKKLWGGLHVITVSTVYAGTTYTSQVDLVLKRDRLIPNEPFRIRDSVTGLYWTKSGTTLVLSNTPSLFTATQSGISDYIRTNGGLNNQSLRLLETLSSTYLLHLAFNSTFTGYYQFSSHATDDHPVGPIDISKPLRYIDYINAPYMEYVSGAFQYSSTKSSLRWFIEPIALD